MLRGKVSKQVGKGTVFDSVVGIADLEIANPAGISVEAIPIQWISALDKKLVRGSQLLRL